MLASTRFSRSTRGVRKRELLRFGDWLCFTSAEEGLCILDLIAAAMERRGYAHKEIFGVRLAVEEALVNAVKHGNRYDPTKCAWASWHVGPSRVLIEIEDEGDGFDPRAVPDPCVAENLERSCGRGVFLMRHYMSAVRFNRRGNRVTMCKRRAQTEGLSD
jgi:serine/threonine-protein kinase RsbW